MVKASSLVPPVIPGGIAPRPPMKFPLCPLLLPAALVLFANPATAQTIAPSDRFLETAFYAEQIQFLYNPGPTLQEQQAGLNIQTVTGFGPGYVYDFCADFFTGADTNSTFAVTPGLGGLGSTQQAQVQTLFSNALPVFNGMLDDYIAARGSWSEPMTPEEIDLYQPSYEELLAYAGGMQIALWEIIHETSGQLSVDNLGGSEGDFFVDMLGSPTYPGTEAGFYAEQFLFNIRTTTNPWTDQGGLNYHYADPTGPTGTDEQDRIWVTVVPEPSSVLLGAAGFMLLLRRRRA
jgi:hypothetical protein